MLLLASNNIFANPTAQEIEDEITGFSSEPQTTPTPDSNSRLIAMGTLVDSGLLLIPESTNDRVMAFDPMTGNLLDADFIPSDPTNLSTPIHAIISSDRQSFLVSDQIDDAVQQYDLNGSYMGIFAPAGGVDNSILDNVRGVALDSSGNLLVTVGGGANDDSVAQFDTSGNYTGNFVANASGGLDSPFDIYLRTNSQALVGGITSDALHSYDISGNYLSDFSPINTFPEQIFETNSGNILVANFSGTEEGVVEYDSAGNQIGIYDPASLGGYRGVYELPNGNILTTNGSGVHEIDRLGNVVETKISGVSARFIEYVPPAPVAAPIPVPMLSLNTLIMLILGVVGIVIIRKSVKFN